MSDNADDSMKMLSLRRAEGFFSYEEGQEGGELYLVIGKTSEERAGLFDDMELFGAAVESEVSSRDSDKDEEAFGGGLVDPGDEELTNPIKHYIKEMGGGRPSHARGRKTDSHAHRGCEKGDQAERPRFSRNR